MFDLSEPGRLVRSVREGENAECVSEVGELIVYGFGGELLGFLVESLAVSAQCLQELPCLPCCEVALGEDVPGGFDTVLDLVQGADREANPEGTGYFEAGLAVCEFPDGDIVGGEVLPVGVGEGVKMLDVVRECFA